MRDKYVQEWILKAEQDYHATLVLSRHKSFSDIVCFHAHQYAEKILKSLLAKHRLKIPKTHNLIFLSKLLQQNEPTLELIADILKDLNKYAVDFKYPGEAATAKEAKTAVKFVKEIRRILLSK